MAAATTGPPQDPRDGIGTDDDDLEKKIQEISKIVVKPVASLDDIQETLLPIYCFLMGYAKELLDPEKGFSDITKDDMYSNTVRYMMKAS